ncbi:MAG: hypothetical protein COT71_00335 [Candidatus Andersenbacteria bacterium CG10_big_fil_rev_8_21_14_0_10_54_11]|uniref:Phosphatidylglycerol--prolipoprotein diacylglyceryl transferase n=1 Tax=Candidatus Andersenbacteria bacterium CG10_big_fil_rev_8_21_14_0_10_54_11 TaxID=1974485 RepID=A0A2M6X087_9BACT|nr:MAG: hypothetical protein COT71_00335 [Candidatus Andersenbacteria bacterium CG10_big_fil_rev_8_21_14_0_10_54_11]
MRASTPFYYAAVLLFPSREVAVAAGRLQLRWYGLAYAAAFLLAWRLLLKLGRRLALPRGDWLTVATWAAAGTLLGGRLGFVLLYELDFFWHHPEQIFFLSGGGMSAHGGFLGVGIGLWLAARQTGVSYLLLLDTAVIPAGLGIGLGRLANYINRELYVSPPAFVLGAAEGVLPALLAWQLLRRGAAAGRPAGIFLAGYAIVRVLTEFLRVQPYGSYWGLTPGQWYSLPLLAAGVWLLMRPQDTAYPAAAHSRRGTRKA